MIRHFYISKDLDELANVETELEESGLTSPQIHVLSNDDAAVELHQLNEVESVLKRDVIHSTIIGAVIGVLAAAVVLFLGYILGLTTTVAGWLPVGFLAVVVLGFCTWEGGFIGIQEPHHQLKKFQSILKAGKHVLFVDVTEKQEPMLTKVIDSHPALEIAGVGESVPLWLVQSRNSYDKFVKFMP